MNPPATRLTIFGAVVGGAMFVWAMRPDRSPSVQSYALVGLVLLSIMVLALMVARIGRLVIERTSGAVRIASELLFPLFCAASTAVVGVVLAWVIGMVLHQQMEPLTPESEALRVMVRFTQLPTLLFAALMGSLAWLASRSVQPIPPVGPILSGILSVLLLLILAAYSIAG